jgi:hypothetical protein
VLRNVHDDERVERRRHASGSSGRGHDLSGGKIYFQTLVSYIFHYILLVSVYIGIYVGIYIGIYYILFSIIYNLYCIFLVLFGIVSYPPTSEEIGAMGREIESHQG